MESNGKHVSLDGARLDYQTWADLLGRARPQWPAFVLPAHHQGTRLIPCDFIGFCRGAESARQTSRSPDVELFAQSEALAFGKTQSEVEAEGTPARAPRRRTACSKVIARAIRVLVERLTPETLGALVALYEHSVFTQGAIWNIDSFDQWGVELGKVLAQKTAPSWKALRSRHCSTTSSTNALIRRYRRSRKGAALRKVRG